MNLFDFFPSSLSSSLTKSSSNTVASSSSDSISDPFLLPFLPIPLSFFSLFFFIFLPLFIYAFIDLFSLLFPLIKLKLRSIYFSIISPPTPCYLINYSVFTPPPSWSVSLDRFITIAKNQFKISDPSVEFCKKIMENSGVGEEAAFPPAICGPPLCGPDGGPSVETARLENEFIYKSIINNLLKKMNWTKKDLRNNIDILIVNSSLFNPTPSLSASIINYYSLKSNIEAYNLGGMGCSASLLSIRLASQLLSLAKYNNNNIIKKKKSMALIISNENITQNTYRGDDRTMLVQNAIFRCGGAAILLANYKYDCNKNNNNKNNSNNTSDNTTTTTTTTNNNNNNKEGITATTPSSSSSIDSSSVDDSDIHPYGTYSSMPDSPFLSPLSRPRSMPLLQLEFTSRYHMGNDNTAYQCVWQQNDNHGYLGIKLSKQLMKIAGISLTKSIELIVWKLLPINELIRYGIILGGSIITKFIQKTIWKNIKIINTPKPRWNKGIDHFCVHAGGRAVLDGVAEGLGLTESEMQSSRATLYRMGNVSSASCWYEIDWLIQTGQLKNKIGERIWQITFGAGFKCNHAVWKVVG